MSGRVRRSVAILVAVVGCVALAPPSPAVAAGGTYDVIQCHYLYRGIPDAQIADNAAYAVRPGCADADADHALKIESTGPASEGKLGRVRWSAPPGTAIVAVRVNARLRRDNGHRPRLYMADDQLRETALIATGTTEPTGWTGESWQGPGQDQFVARLRCEFADGCRESTAAKTWIRGVRLTLKDYRDPGVEVEGSLFATGWVRGVRGHQLATTDDEAGLARVEVAVNGASFMRTTPACPGHLNDSTYWSRLRPCPVDDRFAMQVDTTGAPFLNGANVVTACAADAAGNSTCQARTVRVDNAPPILRFVSQQDPNDPELIRVAVSDPDSGLASGQISFRAVGSDTWRPLTTQRLDGELRARVDSAAEPEGEYEFMVEAADVAGNQASTTLREDGTPMRLQFPLRSGVDLSARLKPGGAEVLTLDYGESSRVVGRLTTAAGEPMAGREVVVDEYFGEGALIDHRIRTVVTDERGWWTSRLPAGPSRSVTAEFAGDQRYLSDEASGGRLAVRAGARFSTSRDRVPEGQRVLFTGRVGRLGARIPSRGKLLQLQYHDPLSRRWFTVRNAFYTDPRGRYRFGYRFGRHYETDVRIRFRLRVMPESNFPYRAVNSRPRRVVIVAR